jgi:hypothetical protein
VTLTGIAASPGVAIGPVFVLEPEELAVRETEIVPALADADCRRSAPRSTPRAVTSPPSATVSPPNSARTRRASTRRT